MQPTKKALDAWSKRMDALRAELRALPATITPARQAELESRITELKQEMLDLIGDSDV